MNKIFLAFSFRNDEPQKVRLVREVDRLIRSHDLVTVTGEVLGGTALAEIQTLIAESDALVAVLTREQVLADGTGIPTQWVRDELTSARAKGKKAIALLETGIQNNGAFAGNEYIPLDLQNPGETLVRLSETVRLWKQQAGRFLLIRLLPAEAARLASAGAADCSFRLVPPRGPATQWQKGEVKSPPGGVFLAVPGVQQDVAVQVKISDQTKTYWESDEFPQWVHVEMRRAAQ